MSFIWPSMLFTLILVPALVGLYLRLQRRRLAAAAVLGPLAAARNTSGRGAEKRRHVPPALHLIGLTLLLLALARPEMVVSLPRIEGTVILAFDVSNSMTADDLEPTRIEAAKAAARAFIENQPSTVEIGVVAFSNGGLVVQQPTHDQAAVLSTIERLSPQGGTSLGQGIFTSLNAIAGKPIVVEETAPETDEERFRIEDYSSAVIVLLSDGENTEPPDPLEVAQVAAEAGVRIYPVGIGSPEGAILEIEGFNILSQLNEPALQDIAGLTNGRYYQAADETELQSVYENIDLQFKIDGEKMEVTAVIAGISALLFVIGAGLSMLWFGRAP